MPSPSAPNPYSFSSWFEQSTATVKAVIRHVGLAIAAAFMVTAALVGTLVYAALSSGDAREIRDILRLDEAFDSSGSTTVELTTAERDRVLDLLGDMAWTWLPLLGVALLAAGLVATWATVAAARAADMHVRRGSLDHEGRPGEDGAPWMGGSALRRVPAVLGTYLVMSAVFVGLLLAMMLPLIVALAADGGDAALVLAGIFGVLGAIGVSFLVWVRLSLAPPISAIGGHGLGLARSWELTAGHFWGTFARLFVAGLIASVISAPLNFAANFGFFGGLAVIVGLFVLLQALSSAASTLVTTPASVVLIHHLDEQRTTAA